MRMCLRTRMGRRTTTMIKVSQMGALSTLGERLEA